MPKFKDLFKKIIGKRHAPLGSLIELSTETWDTATDLYPLEFPYIDISAVGLGTNEYSVESIPSQEAPSRAKHIVRADDIIVSLTRPHRGAIALIKPAHDGSIASTGFAVLRQIKKDDLNRDFLLKVLGTSICLQQFLQRSSGGNYPAITENELMLVLVPLPPLDIQKKLVDEMEMVRESRKKKLQQADKLLGGLDEWMLQKLGLELIKSVPRTVYAICRSQLENRCDVYYYSPHFLRVAHLIDLCRLPKKPLGDICPEIAGGATPKVGDHGLYDETGTTGIKFLRILNIKPNEIDLNDVKYIEESVHTGELQRSQLQTDDVLMTITGRVGTAAVVTDDLLPANINQHIVRLRVFDDEVLPEYLAAFLNTSVGLALSNRGVTGGTRIALDYDTIRRLSIPVPDRVMQHVIATEVRHRKEEARRLRAEAESEWAAAKERFEAQLLGGSKK